MKEAVIMTREEYKGFYNSFQALKDRLNDVRSRNLTLEDMLHNAEKRCENLWNQLNRPAIEAAEEAADNEFYDWCDSVAQRYEKLDEEEWMLDKARFYNNGLVNIAKLHQLPNDSEAVKTVLKYYDLLMQPYEWDYSTEGWSDLKYYRGRRSWILQEAYKDAWERYEAHEDETGPASGKYWKIAMQLWDMKEESKCLGNGIHEWYR